MKDAKTIKDCLDSKRSTAQSLLARAQMLRRVQEVMRGALDAQWCDQVRVANIRDGTLVVFAENAGVATMLRFDEARLLNTIREQCRHAVWKLETKVRPR